MASHKSLLKTIQTEIMLLQNVVLVTPTLSAGAGACLGAPYNYAWHVNKITKQELPRT